MKNNECDKYRIVVRPTPRYVGEQSDPDSGRYVFAYTIAISNTGSEPAQLVARHWIITDASDKVEEVRGLGVVGEQPVIKPGDSYQYTSGCVLSTPVGTMRGSYRMLAADGTRFDVEIPAFTLAAPNVLH